MKPVVIAPDALADLASITRYIAEDNGPAADRFVDCFMEQCALLARMPRIGRARPELRRGFRGVLLGDYLVLYRVRRHSVEIARVVHGARDLEALF